MRPPDASRLSLSAKKRIALHVAGRISDSVWNKLNSFVQSAKKEDRSARLTYGRS